MSAFLHAAANASTGACHARRPSSQSLQIRRFSEREFYPQDTVNCVNLIQGAHREAEYGQWANRDYGVPDLRDNCLLRRGDRLVPGRRALVDC